MTPEWCCQAIIETKRERDKPGIDKYSYIYRRNMVQRLEALLERLEREETL